MISRFFKLGELPVYKIITFLFYMGILPIIFKVYSLGREVYLTNTYSKTISYMRDGQQWYTNTQINNIYLAIIISIISFIILIIIWKLICELLLIIFSFFENKSNKS